LGVYPGRGFVLKQSRDRAFGAFAAFADGSKLLCAVEGSVEIWNLQTGKHERSINHPESVIDMAISPDEKTLLTITLGAKSPARLWDLQKGALVREYAVPFEDAEALTDDPREAVWSFPWSSEEPENGIGFTSVAFSSKGDRFAVGCNGGGVYIYDVSTGGPVAHLPSRAGRVASILVSPEDTRLLTSSMGTAVQYWEIGVPRLIREYAVHNDAYWALFCHIPFAFSADGTRFAFSRQTDLPGPKWLIRFYVHLQDARTGEQIAELAETIAHPAARGGARQPCIALLPDEHVLLSTGGVLQIWDLDSKRLTKQHAYRGMYPIPSVAQVEYLSAISAAMVVEVEDSEDTLHQDWMELEIIPLSRFEKTHSTDDRDTTPP
jgi:WD40 repeat protein